MKRASLIVGILALIAVWCLVVRVERSFAVHMIAHMALVAIAAPLIAIGLGNTWPSLSRWFTGITPLTASLLELVVVWFWHLPKIRILADQSLAATMFEQVSFLVAGLLLWLSCLDAPRLAGAAGLLFTSIHMTLLGVLLAPALCHRSGDLLRRARPGCRGSADRWCRNAPCGWGILSDRRGRAVASSACRSI